MSESVEYGGGPGRNSEDLVKEILKSAGWGVVETREASEEGRAPVAEGSDGSGLRLPDFLAQHPRHTERYVEVKSKANAVHYGIEDQDRHGYEKAQHDDYLEYRELSGRPVYVFVHERNTGVILRQRVRNLPSGHTVTDEGKLQAFGTDEPMIFFPRDAFEPVVDNIGEYLCGFGQDGLLKAASNISPFGMNLPGTQSTLGESGEQDQPENAGEVAEIIWAHKSITFPELVREFISGQELTEAEGADVVKRLEAEGLVYLVPHDSPAEEQVVKLP